jgi:hypothetical protein
MRRITLSYLFLVIAAFIAALCAAASAATPVRGKYFNTRLGYEVALPPGVVCMRLEPDRGCGFNIALRFAESEWKTDAPPARYMWVSGEFNTGDENTLERAVQRAVNVGTAGRAGAIVLQRKSYMAGALPASEFEISYNAEEGEAIEKFVIMYRERKGSPNVIYTFGLHTPRANENDDVRLFHEFVSGFRAK